MAITLVKNRRNKHNGEYRIRIQPMVNGEKVSVPVHYAKTKREAQRLEDKLKEQAKSGFDFAGSNDFLFVAFSRWIQHQVELDRWSPVTLRSWRFTERMVQEYCPKVRLKDCDEDVMRQFIHNYVNGRGVTVAAHSSADRLLQQLRTYFLTLEGISIRKSPIPKKALDFFFRKDRQTVNQEKYVLTDDEYSALRLTLKQGISEGDVQRCVGRLFLWLELETGMRPQEVQALRFDDLIQEEGHWMFRLHDSFSQLQGKMNGHLKFRKIGETRLTPPITEDLYQTLIWFQQQQAKILKSQNIHNPENLVCLCLSDYRLTRLSKPITQRSANELLKSICSKIGVQNGELPITCYTLRTTVATRLARLGDYSYASDRLGNSLEVYMRFYVKPLNRGYSDLMDRYLAM